MAAAPSDRCGPRSRGFGAARDDAISGVTDRPAPPLIVVVAGDHERLTARELELVRLLARGMSYSKAARLMRISLNSVRSHVRNAYGKLGVDNKTSAVVRALELGLLADPTRGPRDGR
jgi:DNA-binding CsgD family transcriptional regulator